MHTQSDRARRAGLAAQASGRGRSALRNRLSHPFVKRRRGGPRSSIWAVLAVALPACACPSFVERAIVVDAGPERLLREAKRLALVPRTSLECDPDDCRFVYVRHPADAAPWHRSVVQTSELGQLALRLKERGELAMLGAAELLDRWRKAVTPPERAEAFAILDREALLMEIAGRPGADWTELLAQRVASLQAEPSPEGRRELVDTLSVLRTRQKIRGPLELRVEPGKSAGTVRLTVKNLEPIPLARTIGGDYRSGRLSRICVELRAPDGTLAPWIDPPTQNFGGGLHWDDMPPGATAAWEIDPRLYMQASPGVQYTARLGFSTHMPIDELADPVTSLIAWTDPFSWLSPPRRSGASGERRE